MKRLQGCNFAIYFPTAPTALRTWDPGPRRKLITRPFAFRHSFGLSCSVTLDKGTLFWCLDHFSGAATQKKGKQGATEQLSGVKPRKRGAFTDTCAETAETGGRNPCAPSGHRWSKYLGLGARHLCLVKGQPYVSIEARLKKTRVCLCFFGEGSPTKIDYRKQGTLILTSLLEDLLWMHEIHFAPPKKPWLKPESLLVNSLQTNPKKQVPQKT